MTGRNQASNSQLASPSQSGSSASAQNGTTDGTPKSERPLPGALPQGTPDSGLDTPRDTAGLTGLPWKLWRPGSHQEPATAQQQQQQQQSGGKPASNGSNSGGGTQPFLDLMSFPSLNLNNLNPLSFLSASSNSGKSSTSPSSSRQATPRPLAAPHLGAPFEEVPGPSQTAPKKPAALHVDAQEEQNLKLDEDDHGTTVTVPDTFRRGAQPSPTVERPRMSLNTSRLSRRPSESPASPQFRQAESKTSMDPTTLHAIARASSEGDALRAVSQRYIRDRNRSSSSSMDRKAVLHQSNTQQTSSSSSGQQPYNATYSRLSSGPQHDQHVQFDMAIVDTPDRLEFDLNHPDAAVLNNNGISQFQPNQAAAASAEGHESDTSRAELGPEEKPAVKRSLLKRLGFSRFPSTSNALPPPTSSSLSHTQRGSNATAASTSDMDSKKHARLPSACSHGGTEPGSSAAAAAPPSSRRRFSISSISTNDSNHASDPQQQPMKTSARTKVHRVKTKVKGKEAREFGHLFLAQELRLTTPMPLTCSPSLESASSFNPLDSQTSLAMSSVAASSECGRAIATMPSTASVNLKKKPAVWAMEFSKDGAHLAVAGHDAVVRVWKVLATPPSTNEEPWPRSSNEQEHLAGDAPLSNVKPAHNAGHGRKKTSANNKAEAPVFESAPSREYIGHSGDVLDLSWSKNNFLLTSSMDKTVRLWHVSQAECLCIFQHSDFVTSVAFHPRDDRFFLSGSLDCRLRLWNVPNKTLHACTELGQLVTSVAFSADGKTAMSGSFSGQVALFDVDNLQQRAMIEAKSNRGKNQGKKITHLDCVPSSTQGFDHLLVTSNDSRLRLYNTHDKSLEAKYSGHENASSQIRASFSDDGRFIICGSEDGQVYIWDSGIGGTKDDAALAWMARKKPVAGCETFSAETSITTCALIAPSETKQLLKQSGDALLVGGLTRERSGSIASSSTSHFGLGISPATTPEAKPQALPLPGRSRSETVTDAIIVTADDQSGVVRVYRNSPYSPGSATTPAATSRYLRPTSTASNAPSSRRASRVSPHHTPEL